MTPTTAPDRTPKTMIGPATTNIFAAIPVTIPSALNSSAGEATLLANPVMGTMDPAPATLPMRSYTPSPVSRHPRKMSATETAPASSSPASPKIASNS